MIAPRDRWDPGGDRQCGICQNWGRLLDEVSRLNTDRTTFHPAFVSNRGQWTKAECVDWREAQKTFDARISKLQETTHDEIAVVLGFRDVTEGVQPIDTIERIVGIEAVAFHVIAIE